MHNQVKLANIVVVMHVVVSCHSENEAAPEAEGGDGTEAVEEAED